MKFQNRKSLMKTSRTIIGDKRKEETKKEEETKDKKKRTEEERKLQASRDARKVKSKALIRIRMEEKSEEEVQEKARLENKIIGRRERIMDQEHFNTAVKK